MRSAVLTPIKDVIALRETKLTEPMCHLQTLKRYLTEVKILARTMNLISLTARVC